VAPDAHRCDYARGSIAPVTKFTNEELNDEGNPFAASYYESREAWRSSQT